MYHNNEGMYHNNEGMYHNIAGRGEEGPLCDPGSEVYYSEGGRESSARVINGMEKASEEGYYCCNVIRYPSKVHQSRTRSRLNYAIGPCMTSLITGPYKITVIELAELLGEWWFHLSTNPSRADLSNTPRGWFTQCKAVSRQGVE